MQQNYKAEPLVVKDMKFVEYKLLMVVCTAGDCVVVWGDCACLIAFEL